MRCRLPNSIDRFVIKYQCLATMLTFVTVLGLKRRVNTSKRICERRRTEVRVCIREMYSDNGPKWSQGEICTYCENNLVVTCPVCNGEGVMGRTILCYYCRGKKTIDCPLCAVDDVYSFSYSKAENKFVDEENESGSIE